MTKTITRSGLSLNPRWSLPGCLGYPGRLETHPRRVRVTDRGALMATAFISCASPAIPSLVNSGTGYEIVCSDSSIPSLVPAAIGLSDLAWTDVFLLISAVLLSACLATGWNMIGKLFYRG